MRKKIRVLVVDDSLFVCKALQRIITADPETEVAGFARDGREAMKKALSLKPDVVTMDVMMPGLDGLEALKGIMETRPVPVLMLSQFTSTGAELTLKALELGAMDFVDKSSAGIMEFQSLAGEILAKIKAICGNEPKTFRGGLSSIAGFTPGGNADVVAIGASTGGPPALHAVLQRMPAGINFGIVIVQHMPPGFTAALASRLDSACGIRVKEAAEGERIEPGTALIAPSGVHMKLQKDATVKLDHRPERSVHKPSVDVLFRSVAETFGPRSIGVVLTGMGTDGAEGIKEISERGGKTIAQDEGTSVIYGMPRAAAETGVLDVVAPLERITEKILSLA